MVPKASQMVQNDSQMIPKWSQMVNNDSQMVLNAGVNIGRLFPVKLLDLNQASGRFCIRNGGPGIRNEGKKREPL